MRFLKHFRQVFEKVKAEPCKKIINAKLLPEEICSEESFNGLEENRVQKFFSVKKLYRLQNFFLGKILYRLQNFFRVKKLYRLQNFFLGKRLYRLQNFFTLIKLITR